MFKDLKNLWIVAFGFSVNHVSDGPDAELDLHDDPLYYFNLNKQQLDEVRDVMTRDDKVMMYQRGQANCYREIGKLVDQLCDSILKESEVLGDDEANRQVVLKKIERIRESHKMLLEAQK